MKVRLKMEKYQKKIQLNNIDDISQEKSSGNNSKQLLIDNLLKQLKKVKF